MTKQTPTGRAPSPPPEIQYIRPTNIKAYLDAIDAGRTLGKVPALAAQYGLPSDPAEFDKLTRQDIYQAVAGKLMRPPGEG